jgi:hypothetical protein
MFKNPFLRMIWHFSFELICMMRLKVRTKPSKFFLNFLEIKTLKDKQCKDCGSTNSQPESYELRSRTSSGVAKFHTDTDGEN